MSETRTAPEVVTLGECMAVLYPDEPVTLIEAESVLLDIAGAEANLAIGLSRLGHRASFISRVGADSFGQRIRRVLDTEGVNCDHLLTDDGHPTGIFFREWLPDGMRRVLYYRRDSAASHLAPEDLQPAAFFGARIVHLTGITPALSKSCAAAVARAVQLAHDTGALVSFDPNYRAPLWEPAQARKVLLPLMEQADILLMGHEDVYALLGLADDQLEKVATTFQARITVLKRAEQGAWASIDGKPIEVPAYPVDKVVDPVGAGDAFNAGFLAGWLRGYSPQEALKLGARMGAVVVSSLGDYAGLRELA